MRCRPALALLAVLVVTACRDQQETSPTEVRSSVTATTTARLTFATIGDYGDASTGEADVADLVKSWNPDHVLTLGDNNYNDGEAATIDTNIGQFYHSFIYPYTGSYGAGATTNRFWPTLGNHEYHVAGATPYLDYFALPGNERYYEFRDGPVHFFALNSNVEEPDGNSSSSIQAKWLKTALAASSAPWKVVFFHHPPFSSGAEHGNSTEMQWPFQEWGADVVIAGHDHTYERFIVNGFPYIVNGLGGKDIYDFGPIQPGSVARYNADYGAQLVEATEDSMTLEFYSRTGVLADSYTMTKNDEPLTTTSFKNGALPTSSYAGNTDTYLSQNNIITNYGDPPRLLMDGSDPSGLDKRSLLKWDVSAIPASATVTAASITLNVVNSSLQTYEIYQLKRSWSESWATWLQYASGVPWTMAGADGSADRGTTVLGAVSGATAGSSTTALNGSGVALVQGWVNGTVRNRGVMIMNAENTDGLDVSSSEAAAVATRPKLTVTYTTTSGDHTVTTTISFQNGALPTASYAGNIDTYISQNNTGTNYAGSVTPALVADGSDPLGLDKRALLKWDVSVIPASATVMGATIALHVVDASPQSYELYQLKQRWRESGATWLEYTSGVPWTSAGADDAADRGTTAVGKITGSKKGFYTIVLNDAGVALVQGWIDGSIANHGVIIVDTNNTNGLHVSSSEAATALRPKLTVTYR